MRKVIGAAFLSLDGVMQAPGGPTEDPTGGFDLGGWLFHYFDEAAGQRIDKLFGRDFDLLLGRRTYDIFAAFWPYAEGEEKPMGERFDRAAKYVLTRGDQPLSWQNSHRLRDLDGLAALKQGEGPDLLIQGSSTLYPQLLASGLIDRLVLMTFPVVIGRGKRMFGEGTPARSMRLVEQEISPDGTIIAVYEPAGEVVTGSFAGHEPSAAEHDRQDRISGGVW